MEEEANDPNFPSAFKKGLKIDAERAIGIFIEDQNIEQDQIELDVAESDEERN